MNYNNDNVRQGKHGFDLYEAVNGMWESNYIIPPHNSEWGTLREISHNVDTRLKKILSGSVEVNITHKLKEELRTIQDFFNIFITKSITKESDMVEARALQKILSIVLNNDNDRSILDGADIGRIIGMLEIHKINPFFTTYSNSDPKDTDTVRLTLTFPSLILPDRIYYTDDVYSEYTDAYVEYVDEMFSIYLNLITTWSGAGRTGKIGKIVLDVETQIAKSTKTVEQKKEIDSLYNRLPIMSFIDNVKLCGIVENSDCSEIDKLWNAYFNTVCVNYSNIASNIFDTSDVLDAVISPSSIIPEEIVVYDMAYFQKLSHILITTPTDKLIYYIAFRTINALSNLTIRSFDQARYAFFGKKLGGCEKQAPIDDRVLDLVNDVLGEALGRIYIELYFSDESKHIVENMVDGIIKQMEKSIKTNKWMEKSTKEAALLKLSNIGVKIGFPNPNKQIDRSAMMRGINERMITYKKGNTSLVAILIYIRKCFFEHDTLSKIDGVRDRDEWSMDPQVTNAYYCPQLNEIVFPAAIMLEPVFNPSNDCIASNYGAIGVVIAHEITHGFDDQGRKYDHRGNINNWWSAKDLRNFNLYAKRMIEQYSKYEIVIEDSNADIPITNTMCVNGNLTLGENIADLGGVTLSYRAYMDANPRASNEDKKKFFESYALLWRAKTTPSKTMSKILSDPHAPNKCRVMVVRNIDDFYTVYGIGPESPMFLEPSQRIKMF